MENLGAGKGAFGRIKGRREGRKTRRGSLAGDLEESGARLGGKSSGTLPNRYAWPRAGYTAARRKTKRKRDPMNL